MGILSDIAADLDISIVKAGHLISAYSGGVAIGSTSLLFLRRLPLRRLMLLLAAVIAIGNALVALSPNYGCLLAARFIAGLPHGAFFGAGAIVCSRLADPGKGASAVAVLIGGMTVANLVGVPGFTFICHLMSWRLPFAIVALIGLVTFVAIRCWVPVLSPLPDTGMKGQFHFLSKPQPWLIYGGVFFGQASVYCWLSYIAPIMTEVARFSESSMTLIMVLVGAGMVFGQISAVTGNCHYRNTHHRFDAGHVSAGNRQAYVAAVCLCRSRADVRPRRPTAIPDSALCQRRRDAWGCRHPDSVQRCQRSCRSNGRGRYPPRLRPSGNSLGRNALRHNRSSLAISPLRSRKTEKRLTMLRNICLFSSYVITLTCVMLPITETYQRINFQQTLPHEQQ